MSSLPTGTVTLWFSDIEGNTPLWECDPQAMNAALQMHNAILRHAIESNGGVVFKIIGDEFQAAFSTAPQALSAAIEAQRGLIAATWNELGPLRVRMGFHTGEAHLDDHGDEYAVSHTKNRGHRVMEAGHGGQILLSQESADLCQRDLPEGVYLKDLGEHHIRNWKLPEHFFQVIAPGLPKDFPPLRTQVEPKHNLPVQLTSFVGREKEIEKIEDLLQKYRLVTLTGPGGTGKTRLALQVAFELLDRYPDGVWLVELAPLTDPELVTLTAASVLGMHLSTKPQILSFLEDYLQSKQLLMILDNCEHLIEACAQLADTLLHACLHLKILTSSREALGIEGEASFRVPPLAFPKADEPLESLAQYEAVRLFVERAGATLPGFKINAENAPAIARVCQRLDGIPLAIELAAARLRLLSAEEIAGRLDDRFRLLTGGSRAALPRYQTLRASIDWSYDLLSPPERILLQRLSVFASGWTLEAAERVGCWEDIQSCDILDLLAQLVNKSLVIKEAMTGSETRYRMLETIRQYAHEKLIESGQAEAARSKHLQYFLELAEKAKQKVNGPDQARTLDRLEAELENLRLALAWSLEVKDGTGCNSEPGLSLAAALSRFWHLRGREEEGVRWLELLLSSEGTERMDKPVPIEQIKTRGKALLAVGDLLGFSGKGIKGIEILNESRALFAQIVPEGRPDYAWVLESLGGYYAYRGNLPEAQNLLEESLVIFEKEGDRFGISECIHILGEAYLYTRDYPRAKGYFEKCLLISKEIGDDINTAYMQLLLGGVAFYQDEPTKARTLWDEGLGLASKARDINTQCMALMWKGILDWMEGKHDLAADYFHEVLSISRGQGFVWGISVSLSNLGKLALSQGNYELAAKNFEENLNYDRKHDLTEYIARSLCDLGNLAWAEGDLDQATRRYLEVQTINLENFPIALYLALFGLGKVAHAQGDFKSARLYFDKVDSFPPFMITWTVELYELFIEASALLAFAEQHLEHSVRLLGATQAWHQRVQPTRSPRERQERENAIASLRQALGEETFMKAWEEGRAMTLEQAMAYAKEATHS